MRSGSTRSRRPTSRPWTQCAPTHPRLYADPAGRRMRAKGDALLTRVKKGEAMGAVAASAGAKVQHLELNRATAEPQQQAWDPVPAGAVLGQGRRRLRSGDAKLWPGGDQGRPHQTWDGGRHRQGDAVPARPIDRADGRNEFGEMLYAAAKALVKPKTDLALAYQALGVQPPVTSSAPAQAPGKAQ